MISDMQRMVIINQLLEFYENQPLGDSNDEAELHTMLLALKDDELVARYKKFISDELPLD